MGTIEELGLKLVREPERATLFLPDDFPFSVQSLSNTIKTIQGLEDNVWGGLGAGFTEQDGMGIILYLPEGDEDDEDVSLEALRAADLPLVVTQPEGDKPQLKLLALHDEMMLIEPSQVITSTQIRDMIRTRPTEVQEIANGFWRVSLHKGYLKLHTQQRSNFNFSKLKDLKSALTPNYPHVTEYVRAYIHAESGARTGSMHLGIKLLSHETFLDQDILDDAASPGFTDIGMNAGHVTATYEGPAVRIIDPIDQSEALKEIILDFMLRLGIFPVKAILEIGLPQEPEEEPMVTMQRDFGVIAGRYSNLF